MRLFIMSREYPVEFEIVSFDKEAQRATLRGKYGDYDVEFPTEGEAAEKRKLNYRLEKRDA